MSNSGLFKFFFSIIILLLIALIPQKAFASQILFQDDFNDGNAVGWEEHLGFGGSWQVQNGQYVGAVREISSPISTYSVAGDVNWTNYVYEVRVKGITGVDKKIKFRYKSRGENYELNLRSNPANDLAVGKLAPNGWLKFVPVPNLQNTWYDLKVELNENNIKIYVNGELEFDFTDNDNPILNGKIGLEVWPGAGAPVTKNIFDDIKVTKIETGPEPFLDLPWDYNDKGLSFSDAALSINSYFDHEYPLLSTNLDEPADSVNNLTTFRGQFKTDLKYSRHDGYDWGRKAKAIFGESVLAAASGIASYKGNCEPCGNSIFIDHQNGYQTRYYHLMNNDLITNIPGEEINVEKGQVIGKVGFSGNVQPSGEQGSHIHFMVIRDKDGDGEFDDNIPDGIVDPFGWKGKETDPWEEHSFNYADELKTGSPSYYLWSNPIPSIFKLLPFLGKIYEINKFSLNFPANFVSFGLNLYMEAAPNVKVSDELESIGSTLEVSATDLQGNPVTSFDNYFTITLDYSSEDLTSYNPDTLTIYSSNDGINWLEEANSINDTQNKKVSADVNHLSYFALIGKRIDTSPPVTTYTLIGTEGNSGWYRSDVILTLTPDDGDGLGVDYTLYRINDQEWQEYTEPITVIDEGAYKIEYYSVDNDENIEVTKVLEFNIDKTKPMGSISASPEKIWPPNGKMVNVSVSGEALDNHLKLAEIVVEDEYHQVEPAISSLNEIIRLQAKRNGNDFDGRQYILKLITEDLAGNITTDQVEVIVTHDQGKVQI